MKNNPVDAWLLLRWNQQEAPFPSFERCPFFTNKRHAETILERCRGEAARWDAVGDKIVLREQGQDGPGEHMELDTTYC